MPPKKGTNKHNHETILQFYQEHPELTTYQIADSLGCSQPTVSVVAREAGLGIGKAGAARKRAGHHCGGTLPKRKLWMTELQYQWEIILHRCGLGMDRGMAKHSYIGNIWDCLQVQRGPT